jgi:type IV secretory pathway TraG/TraD family ATPase VirD4
VIVNGGCANKIFFPGLSPTTCKQIEQMLGKTVIEMDGGKTTKPLLAASEVRTMSHEIFIQSRQAPIQIEMKPYYKIRALREMGEAPPYRIEASQGEDRIEFLPLDVSARNS